MKHTYKVILLILATLLPQLTFAHGDHTHDSEDVKPKNPGAQIHGNETMYLEVVYHDKKLKFYPFTKDQKELPMSAPNFSVSIELPRQKKHESVKLVKEKNYFFAQFDPKNHHRFTVIVKTTGDHSDTFKYTFEPKK